MRPDRVIKLPVFKTMFMPVAQKAWKCDLCKQRVEEGKRYVHYINREPHRILSYRFHDQCFKIVQLYCEERKRPKFTPRTVANWAKREYCEKCGRADCSLRDCKILAAEIFTRFKKGS